MFPAIISVCLGVDGDPRYVCLHRSEESVDLERRSVGLVSACPSDSPIQIGQCQKLQGSDEGL